MALRFQKFDEASQEAKVQSRQGERTVVVIVLVMGALLGLMAWIRGENVATWVKTMAGLVGLYFVWFVFSMLASLHAEFTIRTKEIDGKVSAIEESLRQSQDSHAELLETLTAIAEQLGIATERSSHSGWIGARSGGPIPFPPDIASEYDISTAVSKAIKETGATSSADIGPVIMAARRYLWGKNYDHEELESLIRRTVI